MHACERASEVEVSEGGLWPTRPAEVPKVSTRWSQLSNSAPAREWGEPGRCSGPGVSPGADGPWAGHKGRWRPGPRAERGR